MKQKYLSLKALVQSQQIPWVTSYNTIKKWVTQDMKRDNILKVLKVDTGGNTRYYIKPKNVKKYIKALKKGTIK